jgi:hypothetical protein
MPAGLPYFAWIDASETTFTSAHLRWDEQVFSFDLKQDEGDPASLTAVVRRPVNAAGERIGLLGPGRKIWCWFALDCGPALLKFRGRLVGIPTSIFEELVTLEFVARPIDVVAQKAAVADSLRVLPYYDDAVIDPARRSDPDVVLEGYTKIWHYDPSTHHVSVSDEITGEDGLVVFDGASEASKVLYDGLSLSLPNGPLSRVDVAAEFTWTQQAQGVVDLTDYLRSNWPGAVNGVISSYSMTASDWPTIGAGLGDGWVVADSTATDFYDYTVHTTTITQPVTWHVELGHTTSITVTESYSFVNGPVGQLPEGWIPSGINSTEEHNYTYDSTTGAITSGSDSITGVRSVMPKQSFQPTLIAGYDAKRPYTEKLTFSLVADVQSILTAPEDGEALLIDDVRSVDLSQIIGDPRRRSYIATDRGNRSLEHLICLARAHLMKRARVVEIAFAPKLSRMPEITLRKNCFLVEPRVGEAQGKIIGYSVGLDGNDGRIKCEVRIGCAIGRGGSQVLTEGIPTYCVVAYAGADYQQFNERVVGFTPTDSSVGYQPPNFVPNDDGVNFLSALSAADVLAQPLVVENPLDLQAINLRENVYYGAPAAVDPFEITRAIAAREEYNRNLLAQYETRATFKLKSMTAGFTSAYELQVTDLKIPTGYDLEAS